MIFAFTAAAPQINLEMYSHSKFYPSKDGKSTIVVDYVRMGEGLHMRFPERATLYFLPLDSDKSKEIHAADHYEWSQENNWIITQKWAPPEELNRHYPILKSIIVIYDANGNELQSPGFGTSPSFSEYFSKETIYYFSEISKQGERIPPQLIAYNILKKERKIIYTFEDKYTFWGEQFDVYQIPNPVDYKWGGLRGTIRLKEKLWKNFTFVISGSKIIRWYEDNQMGLVHPPKKK